jgi:hypothetical protein
MNKIVLLLFPLIFQFTYALTLPHQQQSGQHKIIYNMNSASTRSDICCYVLYLKLQLIAPYRIFIY